MIVNHNLERTLKDATVSFKHSYNITFHHYESDVWAPILRKTVFENRVLRNVFEHFKDLKKWNRKNGLLSKLKAENS
jgi:hypothetical protein